MRGHLILADISGYTRFLTASELEHANGILEELLNATIAAVQAPLELSSIEGDAVFLYGELHEDTYGQAVVDSVERIYVAFSSALETMVLNTTCRCNACANIKALGLKIVMHCGEFTMSSIAGRETLTGPDVILTHRLLKNHVTASTGIADYLFVTEACVAALSIEEIVAGWVPHQEEYDHVGVVDGYVASLEDVLEFTRRQNEQRVVERDAWFTCTAFSSAAPGDVWDFMLDPVKRTEWLGANDSELKGTEGGRIGPGTEYHCAHGPDNEVSIIAVIDMKPLDFMTLTVPIAPGVALRWTDYLIPSGEGSRLITHAAPAFSIDTGEALDSAALDELHPKMSEVYQAQLRRLADRSTEWASADSG